MLGRRELLLDRWLTVALVVIILSVLIGGFNVAH